MQCSCCTPRNIIPILYIVSSIYLWLARNCIVQRLAQFMYIIMPFCVTILVIYACACSQQQPQPIRHTNLIGGLGKIFSSAANRLIGEVVQSRRRPLLGRAFSWLKAPTRAFTFKTLLRHYAKRALTPRSLNVKLGPRRKGHKGRAVWLA